MRFLLIIILLLPFNSLWARAVKLTVDGRGPTYNSALSDAKRKAVEQGIGVIIASEEVVNNFQLISDKIFSKSEGYVKTFRELGAQQEPDGTYVVKIEAEETAILDEIVKDQLAVDLLLQWLHKPRFVFLIDENNLGNATSIVAETEIGRLMEEKGFPVFSASQREQIRKRAQSINSAEGDLRAVEAIGNEFAAEYIVLGNATSSVSWRTILSGKPSANGVPPNPILRLYC